MNKIIINRVLKIKSSQNDMIPKSVQRKETTIHDVQGFDGGRVCMVGLITKSTVEYSQNVVASSTRR